MINFILFQILLWSVLAIQIAGGAKTNNCGTVGFFGSFYRRLKSFVLWVCCCYSRVVIWQLSLSDLICFDLLNRRYTRHCGAFQAKSALKCNEKPMQTSKGFMSLLNSCQSVNVCMNFTNDSFNRCN